MRISTKGFPEAVARFRAMAEAPRKQQFRDALVAALEPISEGAKANVNPITGRTVQAVVTASGRSETNPSAYIKVDKRIAFAMWNAKPFPYPFAVEAGHGGKHPAPAHPWFRPAFEAGRSQTRSLVRDGIAEFLHPYMTTLSIGGEFS